MAALLLAGVWTALGWPNDASERLAEAHIHAVDAARKLADCDPSAPGRLREKLHLRPKRTRPRSMRLGGVYEITAVGFTLIRINTYHATSRARKQEELADVHEYVRWLRSTCLELGYSADQLPEYQMQLEISYGVSGRLAFVLHTTPHVFALRYVPVDMDDAIDDSAVALSDHRKRAQVRLLPRA